MKEYRRILDGALKEMTLRGIYKETLEDALKVMGPLAVNVHETRDWSYVQFTGQEMARFFANKYKEVLYVTHDGWTDTIYVWRGKGNMPWDIEEHLKRIGYEV